MMSVSWTVSSQITGISKEIKKEVVSTLVAYPLVLNELKLTNEALGVCNEIRAIQESEITIRDSQINNLNSQIDILDKQNELFRQQLKKSKGGTFKVAAIGVATIVGIILIK